MIPRSAKQTQSTLAVLFFVGFLFVAWFSVILAQEYTTPFDMNAYMISVRLAIRSPWALRWCAQTPKVLGVMTFVYGIVVLMYFSEPHNYRFGREHGSATWASTQQINKVFKGKAEEGNFIISNNVRLGMNMYRHMRNLNILVIGGSGAGKTRYFSIPNLLQGLGSVIVTDPKGEILRSIGWFLKKIGYSVRVFNLVDMTRSDGFNPFPYLNDEKDVLKLVSNLIRNTTPKEARSNDPFWEKAETALLCSIMMYLQEVAPIDEQNFGTVMKLLGNARATEDQGDESVLDILFKDLEAQHPLSVAVSQYKEFKHAGGKTAQSILISAAVRLTAFTIPQIQAITNRDDMHVEDLATKKVAIFCVIPDDDKTYNFLVGMFYTTVIQALYNLSYKKYQSGKLPQHVRMVMDEFANVALPEDFLSVLSTMRSRNMSASIIIQNMAQIKELFKEGWENLVGNCDTLIYLGGNEKSTHQYLSETLGKETIDKKTTGRSRGGHGSSSENKDTMARELMTPDEVRRLSRTHSIAVLSGVDPVCDSKYMLEKHPNYKYTAFAHKNLAYVHTPKESVLVDDTTRISLKDSTPDMALEHIQYYAIVE